MDLNQLPIEPARRRRWILALSGGGYRGLFTARFLEHLEAEIGRPLRDVFDLHAGTSIGSILALGIAYGVRAPKLVAFFKDDGARIFPRSALGAARQLVMPKHSTAVLEEVLLEVFGKAVLSELGSHVVVPAIRLSDSGAEIFRSRNGARAASNARLVSAALASAAAPIYFAPHKIGDQQYIDGGLIANSPDALAVNEAIAALGWPRDELHLLSVGTTGMATGLPFRKGALNWGALRWGWGLRLLTQMMAAQADLSRQSAQQLLGDRVYVVDPTRSEEQDDAVGLDRATPQAAATLIGMADAAWERFRSNVPGTTVIAALKRHVAMGPQVT